jgi:hypothetical protein
VRRGGLGDLRAGGHLVIYTLEHESGGSLRAIGVTPEVEVKPREWTGPGLNAWDTHPASTPGAGIRMLTRLCPLLPALPLRPTEGSLPVLDCASQSLDSDYYLDDRDSV